MDYEKMGDAVMRILARTFQELLMNVTDIQGDTKVSNNLSELLQENSSREIAWEYKDHKQQLLFKVNCNYTQKIYLKHNPGYALVVLLHEQFERAKDHEPENDAIVDLLENRVGPIAVMNLGQNAQTNAFEVIDLTNNKSIDGKYGMDGVSLLCSLFEKFSDEKFKEKIREELDEYDLDKALFEDVKREAKVEMVNQLLVAKFTDLPSDYVKKLHNVSVEKLDSIITNAFRLKSLNDLDQYL